MCSLQGHHWLVCHEYNKRSAAEKKSVSLHQNRSLLQGVRGDRDVCVCEWEEEVERCMKHMHPFANLISSLIRLATHTAVDVDRRLFPKDQLCSVWSNFLASLSLRSFQLLCYQTHPPFFLLLSLLAVLPFVHSTPLVIFVVVVVVEQW